VASIRHARRSVRSRGKARAGEVLVPSAVKERMSQSVIRFTPRGEHRLKGLPERWHLYRLEIRVFCKSTDRTQSLLQGGLRMPSDIVGAVDHMPAERRHRTLEEALMRCSIRATNM
jgi:hypothetical protein